MDTELDTIFFIMDDQRQFAVHNNIKMMNPKYSDINQS